MRNNPVLPVSDPPLAGENDSDGKGVDDRLFKGSAMTKRGAYAALSYMACAGNFLDFTCIIDSNHVFWSRVQFWKIISFTAADSFSIDSASTFVPVKTLFHTLPLAIAYLLYMVVLLCSCVLAFVLNYCIFLNTTLNSALTQTICGNMKDLFTVGLGWMLFGGLPFDLMNVIGQLFGFFGPGKSNFLNNQSMDVPPRRSLAASLSPLRLIDGLPRRRSFNYNQMPEEPIKLTVLKLDGSSFGIQVLKTATVGELKMAVEAAFSHLPISGPGKISWFSTTPETRKKNVIREVEEDGVVDSIPRSQPSFLATVLGGLLSYKSTPSQRGTKYRNVTASRVFNKLIARFRFKCNSEKDVWNRKKLISET
ncbi:hypothetical protein [Arabidopsis thaliana]|nr:hypothetical protein [Arabidopsis thaliana]CAB79945.1 hypothetical protein [Arabidopsis thaliana]